MRAGALGAMIVVLALMGTVMGGYFLNINKDTETVTDYEYVTDVTGLMDTATSPIYQSYNPASNYTGYNLVQEVSTFTNTGLANYRVYGSNTNATVSYNSGYVNNNGGGGGNARTVMSNNGMSLLPIMMGERFFMCVMGTSYFLFGWDTSNNFTNVYAPAQDVWSCSKSGGTVTFTLGDGSVKSYASVYLVSYDPTGGYTYIPSSNSGNVYFSDANDIYYAGVNGSTQIITVLRSGYYATYGSPSGTQVFNQAYALNTVDDHTFIPSAQTPLYNYSGQANQSGNYYIVPRTVTLADPDSFGISYTTTSTANNYILQHVSNSTTTRVDLDGYPGQNMSGACYLYLNQNGWGDNEYAYVSLWGQEKFINLTSYLDSLNVPAGTDYIKIDFDSGQYISGTKINYNGATLIVGSRNTSNHNTDYYGPEFYSQSKGTYTMPSYNYNNSIICCNSWCEWDIVNDTITTYRSDGSVYATVQKTNCDYMIAWSTYSLYSEHMSNPNSSARIDDPPCFMNVTYLQAGSKSYVKINDGISISNTDANNYTMWSNGQSNGSVEILFHANASTNSNRITLPSGDYIDISYSGNHVYTSVNGSAAADRGQWSTFILKISGGDGVVQLVPVKKWTNYTTVTQTYSPINIGSITPGTMSYLKWGATSDSFTFSVYDTQSYRGSSLQTYTGSFDITEYWPELEDYRLRLYSFLTYGSSITINGTTFAVDGLGNMTYTHDDKTETIYMKNVYVETNDGHTYLVFADKNRSIDLGETTTDEIVFGGDWIFTNALFEGEDTLKDVYNWDIKTWGFAGAAAGLFFIGLLAAGLIIGGKKFGATFTDYCIVIIAGVAGFAWLGLFI